MHGRVKQLRQRGKRMSDRKIAATPFVEGDIVVYGLAGVTMAEVRERNTQVGAPLLVLYTGAIAALRRGIKKQHRY